MSSRDFRSASLHAASTRSSSIWTSSRFTDRKSTRLNSSHGYNSYAVFCLKKQTGFCNRIVVQLLADGGCRVADNGRGIPVKPIPKAKDRRPAVEVVLTTLHA